MLGNKLLNIQFAKYHIWNNKRETFNQSVRKNTVNAIPPKFSREINWSEGFPNMVLSTEYSEAVNARYTFQPLWVSGIVLRLQNKSLKYGGARPFMHLKVNGVSV